VRSASVFRTLCFDLEAALFFDGSYLDWLFADGLLFDDAHAIHGGFDPVGCWRSKWNKVAANVGIVTVNERNDVVVS
jgi:hypothetical protein